jgi:hypothetical protein
LQKSLHPGRAREEPLVESLSEYFDHIALSEQQITEVTSYLKKIHEAGYESAPLLKLPQFTVADSKEVVKVP